MKEVFSSGTKPAPAPQKSYDEVVEYIVGEIDWCLDDLQENWLPHSDNLTSEIGRFDKKSALAIKSRVLLHAASPLHNPSGDVTKWERAAKAARDVIELMSYTMPPDRDYREAFLGNKAASSPETIFAMRLQASNNLERANYPIATPGGYSGVTPTHDLVKAYEYIGAGPEPSGISYADRDPRLTATVVVNGSIWNGREIDQSSEGRDNMANPNTSKTGYYLKKFLHDDINLIQNTSKEHVWIVFRYGEILLNYAEAMNMAFGPDATPAGYTKSARQALNEVRASASTHLPAVTVTVPADFHAAVKHERRIELAFEGHRYWDLLRWKDAETVLNRPVHGVTVEKIAPNYVYTEVEVADRVFGERHYFWPFSRAEIVNSKGTMSQNKGY